MVALGKLWPGAALLVGRFSWTVADQAGVSLGNFLSTLDEAALLEATAKAIAEEKPTASFRAVWKLGRVRLFARSNIADARLPSPLRRARTHLCSLI
jgi:hypothetical protein